MTGHGAIWPTETRRRPPDVSILVRTGTLPGSPVSRRYSCRQPRQKDKDHVPNRHSRVSGYSCRLRFWLEAELCCRRREADQRLRSLYFPAGAAFPRDRPREHRRDDAMGLYRGNVERHRDRLSLWRALGARAWHPPESAAIRKAKPCSGRARVAPACPMPR